MQVTHLNLIDCWADLAMRQQALQALDAAVAHAYASTQALRVRTRLSALPVEISLASASRCWRSQHDNESMTQGILTGR